MRKSRKSGPDVWEFRHYDEAGVRRTITVGTVRQFPTQSSAMKAIEGLVLRINSADRALIEPPKFSAVTARYIEEEMPKRDSTRRSLLSHINRHILPKWGDCGLNEIRPMPVESWLKDLRLAPKTKAHLRSIMHAIFDCAERWELMEMGKNPIDRVRVRGGTRRTRTPGVLSHEDFWGIIKHVPEPYKTMVVVAQCLGLRVSEIMGLQWGDLDFENGSALVQRSVVHGRVDDVKTEYSRDRVPLDAELIEVLKAHEARSIVKGPGDWVFANPRTRRPYHQEEIQKRYLKSAGEKAGVSFSVGWHTFRHTYRSWLDDTGAPIGVQRELMRHASIVTTMDVYGRSLSNSKREANSKVVQMVLNQKPETVDQTVATASVA